MKTVASSRKVHQGGCSLKGAGIPSNFLLNSMYMKTLDESVKRMVDGILDNRGLDVANVHQVRDALLEHPLQPTPMSTVLQAEASQDRRLETSSSMEAVLALLRMTQDRAAIPASTSSPSSAVVVQGSQTQAPQAPPQSPEVAPFVRTEERRISVSSLFPDVERVGRMAPALSAKSRVIPARLVETSTAASTPAIALPQASANTNKRLTTPHTAGSHKRQGDEAAFVKVEPVQHSPIASSTRPPRRSLSLESSNGFDSPRPQSLQDVSHLAEAFAHLCSPDVASRYRRLSSTDSMLVAAMSQTSLVDTPVIQELIFSLQNAASFAPKISTHTDADDDDDVGDITWPHRRGSRSIQDGLWMPESESRKRQRDYSPDEPARRRRRITAPRPSPVPGEQKRSRGRPPRISCEHGNGDVNEAYEPNSAIRGVSWKRLRRHWRVQWSRKGRSDSRIFCPPNKFCSICLNLSQTEAETYRLVHIDNMTPEDAADCIASLRAESSRTWSHVEKEDEYKTIALLGGRNGGFYPKEGPEVASSDALTCSISLPDAGIKQEDVPSIPPPLAFSASEVPLWTPASSELPEAPPNSGEASVAAAAVAEDVVAASKEVDDVITEETSNTNPAGVDCIHKDNEALSTSA